MDPAAGNTLHSLNAFNNHSLLLVDEILHDLECPVSFKPMDSAAAFPCMHNFHKEIAISL